MNLSPGSNQHAARVFALLAVLLAVTASADASLILSSARLDATPRIAGVAAARGTTGFAIGAAAALPWGESRAFGGEALMWTGAGVLETRGGIAWQLAKTGLFSLSAQTGGALFVVGRSELDVGLGPELSLTGGVGGERWSVELGAQAGAELFFRSGGPRAPLRGLLQTRYGHGPIDVTLFARSGFDFEAGTHPTLRVEGGALVGWRL